MIKEKYVRKTIWAVQYCSIAPQPPSLGHRRKSDLHHRYCLTFMIAEQIDHRHSIQ